MPQKKSPTAVPKEKEGRQSGKKTGLTRWRNVDGSEERSKEGEVRKIKKNVVLWGGVGGGGGGDTPIQFGG